MMSSAYMAPSYGQPPASYSYTPYPQPPPSPPADDASKCSLPSISNLLGLAGNSTAQDDQESTAKRDQCMNQTYSQQSHGQHDASSTRSEHVAYQSSSNATRHHLPPTPPLHLDTSFDERLSPTTTTSSASYSVASAPIPNYAPVMPISNADLPDQRARHVSQSQKSSLIMNNVPYAASYSNPSPYLVAPLPSSTACAQVSGLYYQRPLPQYTPSTLLPMTLPYSQGTTGANPWQHHHYMSPSAATPYAETQDRYNCERCNKGFSRPSSLKIHWHSHTGAKPFKCSYQGCGKTFSVRSNMKRHERGCHAFVLP